MQLDMFSEERLEELQWGFIEQQAVYKDFLLTVLQEEGDLKAQKALGEVLLREDTVIFPERKIAVLKINEESKRFLKQYRDSIGRATKALRDKFQEELYGGIQCQ